MLPILCLCVKIQKFFTGNTVGQCGCQQVYNFVLVVGLKEYFRKSAAEKGKIKKIQKSYTERYSFFKTKTIEVKTVLKKRLVARKGLSGSFKKEGLQIQ